MYVVIVDICAAVLFAGGLALLSGWPRSSRRAPERQNSEAANYARRIAGTMLAAFGLAIGLMVTLFHYSSGG